MAIEDFISERIYEDEQAAETMAPEVAERWLLECKAKRGILLDWMTQRRRSEIDRTIPGPSPLVLQYLALPWSDHPDYLPVAWTPPEPGAVELWGRR